MFGQPKEYPNLQAAIDRVMTDMETVDPKSSEYAELLRSLERLNALRAPTRPRGISPDVVLQTIGYLIGIGIIVSYEHGHVLASKAMSQIKRPD